MNHKEVITKNISKILEELKNDCKLIVVSKYRDIEDIKIAYNFGIRDFAENRVQSLLERKSLLPIDIKWHLIGSLQSNKVKQIIDFISLIHAVDSEKILTEINKQASKIGRKVNILFQLHLAEEDTKHGFEINEFWDFLASQPWKTYAFINFCGIMAMATNTSDMQKIAKEFSTAQQILEKAKKLYSPYLLEFKELSIGMSSDYLKAQDYGSTMVGIGSAVFE